MRALLCTWAVGIVFLVLAASAVDSDDGYELPSQEDLKTLDQVYKLAQMELESGADEEGIADRVVNEVDERPAGVPYTQAEKDVFSWMADDYGGLANDGNELTDSVDSGSSSDTKTTASDAWWRKWASMHSSAWAKKYSGRWDELFPEDEYDKDAKIPKPSNWAYGAGFEHPTTLDGCKKEAAKCLESCRFWANMGGEDAAWASGAECKNMCREGLGKCECWLCGTSAYSSATTYSKHVAKQCCGCATDTGGKGDGCRLHGIWQRFNGDTRQPKAKRCCA